MTVAEIIERLESLPQDLAVVIDGGQGYRSPKGVEITEEEARLDDQVAKGPHVLIW